MAPVDLLVLASSKKRQHRCIAGWDLDNERWVRPVSSRREGALEIEHCAVDGRWPELFDLVRVDLANHTPSSYQPENWLISGRPWQLLERADPRAILPDLRTITDADSWLFDSTDRRVPGATLRANPAPSSLVLVEPTELQWRVETPPWGGHQRKADFRLDRDTLYDFPVTDLPVLARLEALGNGNYPRNTVGLADASEVFLTVSLAEPYQGNGLCYKLVAAVVEIPEEGQNPRED
jgi:hypothetical protein